MNAIRGGLASILATSVAACVLFTDVDGFSNGGGDADASADAPMTTDRSVDASDDVLPFIDASFDAPPDGPRFRDEFARADSPDLGNGWTEKTPEVYSVLGGSAVKTSSASNYRDNAVSRPAEEDRADVEVSAIFTLSSEAAYPQVFARARRTALAAPGTFDAYMFFLAGPGRAILARQRGTGDEVALTSLDFPEQFSTGTRVKLTLRVYGEPPVVESIIDRIEGSGATRVAETKLFDEAPDRIEQPGAVGFNASYGALSGIDDFEWRALGTQ